MKINMEQIDPLIRGEREPADDGEKLFIYSYEAALTDEKLLQTLISLADQYDSFSEYEKNMFLLGYCLGQRDLDTHEENAVQYSRNTH